MEHCIETVGGTISSSRLGGILVWTGAGGLDKGKNVLMQGFFKQRYNSEEYEFKVTQLQLLETAKQVLTKQLDINLQPASLTPGFVDFIEKNMRGNPGKSQLRFNIFDPAENLKISMYSPDRGFTMNEEMAEFLLTNPDVEINVALVDR